MESQSINPLRGSSDDAPFVLSVTLLSFSLSLFIFRCIVAVGTIPASVHRALATGAAPETSAAWRSTDLQPDPVDRVTALVAFHVPPVLADPLCPHTPIKNTCLLSIASVTR